MVKASSRREIRFGKASLKKPLILTVTSILGRPRSFERNHFESDDPPRLLVPDGSYAEQSQDLRDVVALGSHGCRPPHHDADRLRITALFFEIAPQQVVREPLSDLPTRARSAAPSGPRSRSCAPSEARSPARASGTRKVRRARTHPQTGEQVPHLFGRAHQARNDLLGRKAQRPLHAGIGEA